MTRSRLFMVTCGLLTLVLAPAASRAQTSRPAPEVRAFELTATPPPTPALRYELLYDILADRRQGNAAILYLDSVLLLPPDARENGEKALNAYDAKDFKTFASLADAMEKPGLFQELDLAARREQCDWEPPFHEMGVETLLPHLEPLIHGVARCIRVRALRQIEQGKLDDAIATLRLGYALGQNVGREPVLISGLVSLAITSQMNDGLVRLMNRPEAPNLYWALLNFPSQRRIYQTALYGERRFMTGGRPDLVRAIAGEELSADEWRALLQFVAGVNAESGDAHQPDPVKDATPANLKAGREQYAQSHHLSADAVEKVDPIVVLGAYYVQQTHLIHEDMFKLRGLPYPILRTKSEEANERVQQLKREQPGNPFLPVFNLREAMDRFARADRELAALTTVEALRSFAAAHDRQLPQRLDDITDTPVPENPATGKAFEYRVEDGAATLSDTLFEPTLTYTIRIRK